MSPSVSFRQLYNLTAGKDGGTGDGGVLVTQERMTDTDTAKFDANTKADATNASDASYASKINTPNINGKGGIGKPCTIDIVIS